MPTSQMCRKGVPRLSYLETSPSTSRHRRRFRRKRSRTRVKTTKGWRHSVVPLRRGWVWSGIQRGTKIASTITLFEAKTILLRRHQHFERITKSNTSTNSTTSVQTPAVIAGLDTSGTFNIISAPAGPDRRSSITSRDKPLSTKLTPNHGRYLVPLTTTMGRNAATCTGGCMICADT